MQLQRNRLALLVGFLLVFGSPAAAAPVFFDFSGGCQDVTAGACSFFGLAEGETVSGTFTLDSAIVIPGGSVSGVQAAPGTAFQFSFGSQAFDLADLSTSDVRISFDAGATRITCIGLPTNCPAAGSGDFASWDNGQTSPVVLNNGNLKTHATFVQLFFLDSARDDVPHAIAKGPWQRRDAPSNPIPEPSAVFLFAAGILIARSAWRRAEGR